MAESMSNSNFRATPSTTIVLSSGIILVLGYSLWQFFLIFIKPESCPAVSRIQTNGNIIKIFKTILPPIILIIAVLGSILALAATETNIGEGVLLLSSYSMGLAIPFIISGYSVSRLLIISKRLKDKIHLISITGGIILLLTGIAIMTNQLQILGYFILEYLPLLGNIG